MKSVFKELMTLNTTRARLGRAAGVRLEEIMSVTSTQKALDTITEWGKNPNLGENIVFGLVRQGDPGDEGVFTGGVLFTPKGKRGVLNGVPPGMTGAPVAIFPFAAPEQLPFTFSFDLNAGEVTLNGAFPLLTSTSPPPPVTLDFTVEFIKEYEDQGGLNISFHSEKTSDNAGYIIVLQNTGE
jgi:hypothetical protein